ncbi:hypothetical protein PR048_026479 [Dryococelus australis]|uniref:Uncharacterized protein n=1 Tax=Dryococelus australis TaxID=614101 RepID=A0ABQ9GLG2_9NEOP|nr:hypothetical protein PR048_026479 [Dryococelus australis]
MEMVEQQVTVLNAEEFYKCCVDHCKPKGIEIILVNSTSIAQHQDILEKRRGKVTPIPFVQAKHYFRTVNKQDIMWLEELFNMN